MKERMTLRNPGGTYRMNGRRAKSLRIEYQNGEVAIFGDAINRLGSYEDIGEPEELRALKEAYGIKKGS